MNWFDFIILGLAVWRLSSLFSNEIGPFRIFAKLRIWAGETLTVEGRRVATTGFGEGLICTACESVWWAIIMFTCYKLWNGCIMYIAYMLALSTVAIFIDRIIERLE